MIEFPIETGWPQIKKQRNYLLSQSDWTQIPDAALTLAEKTAWQDYRAAQSNLNGDALESTWRCAWYAAMLKDKIAQPAFCVGGGLAAFFLVGDVYEKFDDAPILAVRNWIGEGVDDDVAVAKQGFVVDGVIKVTSEAGVIP